VFATFDPSAPSLADYLGPVGRLGLSMVSAHGDIAVVEGIQKYRIKCNWKLAVDNLFDWYHPPMTHASALSSGYAGKVAWSPSEHIVALGEYGHAISGPRISKAARDGVAEQIRAGNFQLQEEAWRDSPKAAKEIGEFGAEQRGHPGIFPNLWVASNGTQLSLRLPKGPDCTEIWWFTLLDKNLPADERAACINRSNHFFGPAGMFEQDDGENWDQGTRASSGTIGRRYPMNFAMNLGRGHVKHDASGVAYVESDVNEHAQLWTYRAWAEWMTADSWSALKRHHSIPDDTV
jgi:phenylpropionate dioxygenase-like ring-hydroxylating dioxygenase large terminal subunit